MQRSIFDKDVNIKISLEDWLDVYLKEFNAIHAT